MIASRRQVLKSALALPFVPIASSLVILTEDHCLSEESACGFRKAVYGHHNVIVVAASRKLTQERAGQLLGRVIDGATLLFESAPDHSFEQAQILRKVFGLNVLPAVKAYSKWIGNYVEYCPPIQRLVRPFTAAIPVHSLTARPIARLNGVTVAAGQRLGKGTVIFLGSLLGTGLFAGEREAHDVAAALLAHA